MGKLKTDEQVQRNREYQKRYYRENRQKFLDKAKRARAKRREMYQELKRGPCTDCGVEYPPYVMQFDHVGDNKEFNVASYVEAAWGKVLAEVAKCELVCANCHAERTHTRRGEADW